jgi:hypothetical protein
VKRELNSRQGLYCQVKEEDGYEAAFALIGGRCEMWVCWGEKKPDAKFISGFFFL